MGEDNKRLDELLDAALERRRARRQAGKGGTTSIFIESAEGELFSFVLDPSTNGNGASSNGNGSQPADATDATVKDGGRS